MTDNLTTREKEVLALLAKGLDNHAIAEELPIAYQTVCNVVSKIYEKVGSGDRVNAALWALRNNIAEL
jgi:DNA-binding NarL/FixJ family response regulator